MKIAIIFSMFLYLSGCTVKSEPVNTGLEGKRIPAFTILLSDSATVLTVGNDVIGKSFAIFYFSPFCPYCKAEISEIANNRANLGNTKIYLITSFPFSEMKKICKEFDLCKTPNIITGWDPNYSFGTYFNPRGVPYFAICGPDKRLKDAFLGPLKISELKELCKN